MKTDKHISIHHVFAALLAGVVLCGAGAGIGCATLGLPDNRLSLCKSNEDCKKRDAKTPACYATRCVECANDSDCGDSGFCTDNHCKTFFKADGDSGPEGPPKNLDACLSRCSDEQACVNKCHEQFPSADPAPKPPE